VGHFFLERQLIDADPPMRARRAPGNMTRSGPSVCDSALGSAHSNGLLEALLSLRQPRLAQAVEQVLGILGALEVDQSRLCALDRKFGLDPENLGGLCPGLLDVSQLGAGGGEKDVAGAEIRRPRNAFPQQRQRPRILLEHIVGEPQRYRRLRHMERIQPHVPLAGLGGSHRVSRVRQHLGESPIVEIGVEGDGPLERGDRRLVLTPAIENKSERVMRLGQLGVELHGLVLDRAYHLARNRKRAEVEKWAEVVAKKKAEDDARAEAEAQRQRNALLQREEERKRAEAASAKLMEAAKRKAEEEARAKRAAQEAAERQRLAKMQQEQKQKSGGVDKSANVGNEKGHTEKATRCVARARAILKNAGGFGTIAMGATDCGYTYGSTHALGGNSGSPNWEGGTQGAEQAALRNCRRKTTGCRIVE
jgi:hypothetical protein